MNQYYTDEGRHTVYRFRDTRAEAFSVTAQSWVPYQELYDVLIGELWLDEITEREAEEILARVRR